MGHPTRDHAVIPETKLGGRTAAHFKSDSPIVMNYLRTRMFASFICTLGVWGALGLCLGGCAGRERMDVLEAQLRNQESMMARYESQLKRAESDLSVAQREADLLRTQLAENKDQNLFQETTQALAQVEGMKFHELLTAGQSKDDEPGDERLHAVLYPHDQHGKLVKLSGTLELEAIDLTMPHDERIVGHWQFSPEETRELWHSGFITNGYQLDLPWMKTPQGKKVLLHATLKTLDGREFNTTHTVSIDAPVLTKLDQPTTDFLIPPVQQSSHIESLSYETPQEESAINKPGRILLPDNTAELQFENSNPIQTSDNWSDADIPAIR